MLLIKLASRMRQFFVGLFSVYTKKDDQFATSYLSIQEKALFKQLPGFEKKHAVRVARRMLKALHRYPDLDARKIARLGLLHDIGKLIERNSTTTKAFLVVIRYFWPKLYDHLADKGKEDQRWRRFYIHKHHGEVGANLLAKIGETSEILAIIKKHDPRIEPFGPEDPLELKILQDADIY